MMAKDGHNDDNDDDDDNDHYNDADDANNDDKQFDNQSMSLFESTIFFLVPTKMGFGKVKTKVIRLINLIVLTLKRLSLN